MASLKCLSLGFLVLMCLSLSSAYRVLLDSMHKPKDAPSHQEHATRSGGSHGGGGGGTFDGSTGGMGRGGGGTFDGSTGGGMGWGNPGYGSDGGFSGVGGTRHGWDFYGMPRYGGGGIMAMPINHKQNPASPTNDKAKQDMHMQHSEPMTEPTHKQQDDETMPINYKEMPAKHTIDKEKQDGDQMFIKNKQMYDGEAMPINKVSPASPTDDKAKQDMHIFTKKQRVDGETMPINYKGKPAKTITDKEKQDDETSSIDDKEQADTKHMSINEVIHNEPMPPDSVVDMKEPADGHMDNFSSDNPELDN